MAPATTVCNAGSGDLCDVDELCTGTADQACPVDTVAGAGTVCNAGSGDLCDPDEVCSGTADQAEYEQRVDGLAISGNFEGCGGAPQDRPFEIQV